MWPPLTQLRRTASGVAYATGRLGGSDCTAAATRVLLTHGAGFSKECWAATLSEVRVNAKATVVSPLPTEAADEPPARPRPGPIEWIALDFSGHGDSAEQPPLPATWDAYLADNVRDVMRAEGWLRNTSTCGSTGSTDEHRHDHGQDPGHGPSGPPIEQASESPGRSSAASSATSRPGVPDDVAILAVGHSMGGSVLAAVEMHAPGTFDHTVVIEPPLFPRWMATIARWLGSTRLNLLANAAARRRAVWPSQDAAVHHVATRAGAGWDPRAREAWMLGGFRAGPGGELSLKCHPETEARMLRCLGTPLPALAETYTERASAELTSMRDRFTLVLCAASSFSPMGIPHSGLRYYRHFIVPAFPGGVRQTLLGGGATHIVPLEQPSVLANLIVDEWLPLADGGHRAVTSTREAAEAAQPS